MDWTRKCAAVIPCHNEGASIGAVVAGVRRHLPAVIVVDDGSSDGTAAAAASAGAEVIRLAHNSGKGAALRAGWERARDHGFTWALNLDGDGQHAPEDIPVFLECSERTRAAMIVGNRMDRAARMPWLRRQVNRWMTRRLSRLTGTPLADSQCGFRLLNLDIAVRLPLQTDHFEIESEMLATLVAAGCRVEFVPIQVIYKSAASKIHPCADGWRWVRWWFSQPPPRATEIPPPLRPRMIHPAETHA